MPQNTAAKVAAHERYLQRRVRSPAFRRSLTTLVASELTALSQERIRNVLDAGVVREILQEWNTRLVNREIIAELIIAADRRLRGRLQRRGGSLLDLLDPQLVADIDALFKGSLELSPHAEAFIAQLIRQDFVRGMFTDVIFTAIISFNEKVNPLFGAFTNRVLEEQIKGFVRLFMPMLQQQAITFAISKSNQRLLLDFTRALVRQLLEQPLHRYATLLSHGARTQADTLIRKAVGNAKLDALIRKATVAAWNDLYTSIKDKKVGELLHLEANAGWLAARCVELIVPALSRPSVLRFIAAEIGTATHTS